MLLTSMMLNTLCSRIVNIIDLSMLQEVSSTSSASFLLLNNITFIDYVFAMTFIPVLGVILSRSSNEQQDLGRVFKYGIKIIIITSILCGVVYPIQINLSIDNPILKSETMMFEIINIVYIPFKMLQFMMGNFLSVFKLNKYVSMYSVLSIPLDFILNKVFMVYFGAIGCLISTLFISVAVSFIYFFILNSKYSLIRQMKGMKSKIESNNSFFSEFMRILFEKGADYILFGMILVKTTSEQISNIGLIISILNLLLVQSTMSMRSIAISIKKDGKKSISYFIVNIIFATIISVLFIIIFSSVRNKISFNTTIYRNTLLCIPIVIFVDSISSVMRGVLQSKLKFKTIFFIESLAQWTIYIPSLLFLSKFQKLDFFPVSVLLLNSFELLFYLFYFMVSQNRPKTELCR